MEPGNVEWCKNCVFFLRIYVFGMLDPRGPLGGAKTVPPSVWQMSHWQVKLAKIIKASIDYHLMEPTFGDFGPYFIVKIE